jgi:hypothetical protein
MAALVTCPTLFPANCRLSFANSFSISSFLKNEFDMFINSLKRNWGQSLNSELK